ncbi:MAG: NAD(P)-dependent oxidoreductase [Xanthomonadaceae bacterium]|jgi:nucleoside-diphosphate-sugar epimerase|nr:NAD(P)-dependent oxidoreductase [Xanthomonadaceae bacterium]
MRILVTGASGFIGRHVAQCLATAGYEVVAQGRDADRLAPMAAVAETVKADLAEDPLAPLLRDCEAVVHCAALSSPWGREQDFQRANVLATQRLALAAQAAGVARMVHLGSPSIYFRFSDRYDVPEAFTPPRRWITPYARSKWESEEVLRSLRGRVPETVILRPRAVFGEGDQAILPRLLAVAERGRFPLVGGGGAWIDITYIDNVVHAITLALKVPTVTHGRAYNIANGEPMRVRTLMQKVFGSLDMPVRFFSLPRPVAIGMAGAAETWARCRPGCPEPRLSRYGVGVIGYSQTLDISAARNELGYQPQVDIATGIERFSRFWRRSRKTGRMEPQDASA